MLRMPAGCNLSLPIRASTIVAIIALDRSFRTVDDRGPDCRVPVRRSRLPAGMAVDIGTSAQRIVRATI